MVEKRHPFRLPAINSGILFCHQSGCRQSGCYKGYQCNSGGHLCFFSYIVRSLKCLLVLARAVTFRNCKKRIRTEQARRQSTMGSCVGFSRDTGDGGIYRSVLDFCCWHWCTCFKERGWPQSRCDWPLRRVSRFSGGCSYIREADVLFPSARSTLHGPAPAALSQRKKKQ